MDIIELLKRPPFTYAMKFDCVIGLSSNVSTNTVSRDRPSSVML